MRAFIDKIGATILNESGRRVAIKRLYMEFGFGQSNGAHFILLVYARIIRIEEMCITKLKLSSAIHHFIIL